MLCSFSVISVYVLVESFTACRCVPILVRRLAVISRKASRSCAVIAFVILFFKPSSRCSVMRYMTERMGIAALLVSFGVSAITANRTLARVSKEMLSPVGAHPLAYSWVLASSKFLTTGWVTFMVA